MPKSASKRKLPITQAAHEGKRPLTGPALIRKFHVLQTALQSAIKSQDLARKAALEAELEALGGLEAYQQSSIHGQDPRRGGDTSKVLLSWLKAPGCPVCLPGKGKPPIKVLEIGCLSAENYISQYPKQVLMTRIDLNAQNAAIQQQDFLQRPLPASSEEVFDGISCSLVLNFVPLPDRGRFLAHLAAFLPPPALAEAETTTARRWLFLVLPAPCVANSRYLTEPLLLDMLTSLGFTLLESKLTDRMAYWLLERTGPIQPGKIFKKQERRQGSKRNNFWIPLTT